MGKKCNLPEYRVSIEPDGDCVKVAATKNGMVMFHSIDSNGVSCGAFDYVYPPNIFERVVGITYQDKIRKAEQRWNRWMGRHRNVKNAIQQEVDDYLKDEVVN